MRAKVFKFCVHFESGQVYCGKENQDAEINFCLLFPFLLFSISHSIVVHREICVKDFSGTTAPRILKFGTNVGYDLLHCVRENQPPDAYHSLYLSSFLSVQSNFLLQISWLLWEPESSNFLYTLRVAKYIVRQKTKMLRFIFTIFFHFPFLPSLTPMFAVNYPQPLVYLMKYIIKCKLPLTSDNHWLFGCNLPFV